MLFGRNNIRKGVMAVIREKIAAAQEAHNRECDDLDEVCEKEKAEAETRRDDGKEASAQKHVNSIIGRLL